jgi:protein-disulfide isomerase
MGQISAAWLAVLLVASDASGTESAAARQRGDSKVAPAATSPGITSSQAEAILQELRSIRQLLEKQTARAAPAPSGAPSVPVRIKVPMSAVPTATTLGKSEAPLTILEYVDFQCSFCKRHQDQTLPLLKERYIDKGTVRYVSRNLPLDIHSRARSAALAVRCAAAQGKYWPMRAALFLEPQRLGEEDLIRHARETGLDVPVFEACLKDDSVLSFVRAEVAAAGQAGITGTPAFVVGRTQADQIDGVLILGAQPFEAFEARLEELLRDTTTAH